MGNEESVCGIGWPFLYGKYGPPSGNVKNHNLWRIS
jgi:hypothetical protein